MPLSNSLQVVVDVLALFDVKQTSSLIMVGWIIKSDPALMCLSNLLTLSKTLGNVKYMFWMTSSLGHDWKWGIIIYPVLDLSTSLLCWVMNSYITPWLRFLNSLRTGICICILIKAFIFEVFLPTLSFYNHPLLLVLDTCWNPSVSPMAELV